MTFVAISQVFVKPSNSDILEDAFRNRHRKVDSFEGFIGLSFLRSQKDKNKFIGIFHFKDKESFLKYMRSKEHSVSHKEPLLSSAIISNSVEFYDLVTN